MPSGRALASVRAAIGYRVCRERGAGRMVSRRSASNDVGMNTPNPLPVAVAQIFGPAAQEFQDWIALVRREDYRSEVDNLLERMSGVEAHLETLPAQLDRMSKSLDQMRVDFVARFEAVDARLGAIDSRLEVLQAILSAQDTRLGNVEARLLAHDSRFDHLSTQLTAQMRWSVGVLGVFGALVTAMLAVTAFGP